MTDRPIIYSGSMIRALLAGHKTQTRRVLKPQPEWNPLWQEDCGIAVLNPRYGGPGDRLWLREAWRSLDRLDPMNATQIAQQCVEAAGFPKPWAPIQYEADGAQDNWLADPHSFGTKPGRYRHARFMPRWASRITQIVTDLLVEQVQDISEEDAWAEGVCHFAESLDDGPGWDGLGTEDRRALVVEQFGSGRNAFRCLWDSLYDADPVRGWKANPWVWRITSTVHRCNIDAMEAAR